MPVIRKAGLLAGMAAGCAAAFCASAALAHGEGLHSGARWTCALQRPLGAQSSGAVRITLLDEDGLDAPSVVISFPSAPDQTYILRANWDGGMSFGQPQNGGAEFTLIQNPYQPTDYTMTIWTPATDETQTLAICRET